MNAAKLLGANGIVFLFVFTLAATAGPTPLAPAAWDDFFTQSTEYSWPPEIADAGAKAWEAAKKAHPDEPESHAGLGQFANLYLKASVSEYAKLRPLLASMPDLSKELREKCADETAVYAKETCVSAFLNEKAKASPGNAGLKQAAEHEKIALKNLALAWTIVHRCDSEKSFKCSAIKSWSAFSSRLGAPPSASAVSRKFADPQAKQVAGALSDCGPSAGTQGKSSPECWQKRILLLHKSKQDAAAQAVLDSCSRNAAIRFPSAQFGDRYAFCRSMITDGWATAPVSAEASEFPIAVGVKASVSPRAAKGGDCKGTPESRRRLKTLEDVPEVCMNEDCDAAAAGWDACSALERMDLEKFALKPVISTLSYIDAESVVFLTRARVVDLILKGYEAKIGQHLPEAEIPKSCKDNLPLFAGMKPDARPAASAGANSLASSMPRLKNDALLIKRLLEQRNLLSTGAGGQGAADPIELNSSMVQTLLLRNPELLPPGYKGGLDWGVAVKLADRSEGSGQLADEQVEVVRSNLSASVQAGLKEACDADWKDLMRLPFTRKISKNIADNVTLTENGASRIWTCLSSQADTTGAKDIAADACWAVLTGVTIGLSVSGIEPAALATGAAVGSCTATSVGKHFVDIMEASRGERFNNSCVNSSGGICDEETRRKVERQLNAAVTGIVLDVGAVAGGEILGPLAGKLLGGIGKVTVEGAEWLSRRLEALRGLAKTGSADAIGTEVELISAALGKEVIQGTATPAEIIAAKSEESAAAANVVTEEDLEFPLETREPGATVKPIGEKPVMAGVSAGAAPLPEKFRESITRLKDAFLARARQIASAGAGETMSAKGLRMIPADSPYREAIARAYKALHSPEHMAGFLGDLLDEAGQFMLKSGNPRLIALAEEGKVTRGALVNAMVERARKLGWTKFVTIPAGCCSSLQEFKEIVLSKGGLFFDRAMKLSGSMHGSDVHVFQVLATAQELEGLRPGMTKELFEYMGKPESGKSWDTLFDQLDEDHYSVPETLSADLKAVFGDYFGRGKIPGKAPIQ